MTRKLKKGFFPNGPCRHDAATHQTGAGFLLEKYMDDAKFQNVVASIDRIEPGLLSRAIKHVETKMMLTTLLNGEYPSKTLVRSTLFDFLKEHHTRRETKSLIRELQAL